jgi:hypothetical protein
MRHPLIGVLVGSIGFLAAGGFWPGAAEAADTSESRRASIVVRTYTQPEWEGAVPGARRTVSAILGRSGVDVDWLECALPADVIATPGACAQPLGGNELVVRILPAGTVAHRDLHALGFAFVDVEAGRGLLATVYADRVGLLAQNAGVDPAELLGRAIAHELGHLLLGTNQHASRGLMRASWSGRDLRRRLATEWQFGVKEGDAIRMAIANRQRSGVERLIIDVD